MDALETLLQPVVGLVNRQIRSTTPARELCGELEGRVVAVGVRNTALSIYVRVEAERIALTGTYDAEPDVVISGSPISLAMLAGPDGETAIRDGSVSLAGDAELAAKFQRLLRYGRPDLEEELSRFTGDVAAHELGEIVRSLGRWGRQTGDILQQNVSEYLQEESRSVPSRYEVDDLAARVGALRDDVARLEARIDRLNS